MKGCPTRTRAYPGTEALVTIQLIPRRLVNDVVELQRRGHLAFGGDERDETVQIDQERVHVPKALEVGLPNRAFERRSQVWSPLQQLDQVLDDRDMLNRLLRFLITGAGGQGD